MTDLPPQSRRTRESPQERQAKLDVLRARLHDAAAAIRTPVALAACLDLAARTPDEDFANILLIASQRPDATFTRDYQQWAAAARQVRRGETGIAVFHIPSPPPSPNREKDGRHLTWRDADRVSYVWDLSQTTGAPLTIPAGPSPGQTPAGLREALRWLARRQGFAVEHERGAPSDGVTFWTAHRIRLLPDLSTEQEIWALAHHLGHVLLHHLPSHSPGTTTAGCGGVHRAEADSIAFVICAHHGIAVGRELSHPASWAGSDPRAQPGETILAVGQRILTAAASIISHTGRALAGDNPGAVIAPAPQPAPAPRHSQSRPREAAYPSRASQDAPDPSGTPPAPPAGRIRQALNAAQESYIRHVAGSWVPAYLSDRGIDDAAARHWGIGYAAGGWTTLTDHLHSLGYTDDEIEAAGLARRSSRGSLIDLFRDRVMLPVHDENGRLAGFIGRAHPHASGVPKYLNSPETVTYKKGELLFGLRQALPMLSRNVKPVLVEGPFDAIAVTAADPAQYAGLAPCGTALTKRQAELLDQNADLANTGILVAFDGDAAGCKAAARSYDILRWFTWKLQSAQLGDKDPAEVMQKEGTVALRNLLREKRQMLLTSIVDAEIESWGKRLQDSNGPYLAMRSSAKLIAHAIPPSTNLPIGIIIGGRGCEASDDLLDQSWNGELTRISHILHPGITHQMVRVAARLGFDCSDVLAEVIRSVIETGEPYPPSGNTRGNNVVRAPPNHSSAAPGLASAGFPQLSSTIPANDSDHLPRSRAPIDRPPSARPRR